MTSVKMSTAAVMSPAEILWSTLRGAAEKMAQAEPLLAPLAQTHILSKNGLSASLSCMLSQTLAAAPVDTPELEKLFLGLHEQDGALADACAKDLASVLKYDPATRSGLSAYLFYKGFHALQAWRLSHALWQQGRSELALFLQGRISAVFDVDIHPAARIGTGVTLDHASGLVIGETAVVGDDVLMLHGVTLGTKGFEHGDRHPVIGNGVIIGAGAKVIGRINVGDGAIIAAGSMVIEPVAARHTVAGVPARVVKTPE